MRVEIIMPKMGESIQEGTILHWTKKVGEKIEKDETILEISTDKVDSEIPSPVAGILSTILVEEQATVPVGTIIAFVETDLLFVNNNGGDDAVQASAKIPKVESGLIQTSVEPSIPTIQQHHLENHSHRFYSPLVKSIARKEGINESDLDKLTGSGSNGRVTKKDVLAYLDNKSKTAAPVLATQGTYEIRTVDNAELLKKYPSPKFRLVRMENVQKKMAEHMVRSASTSPHVSAVDEVDMTSIVNFRFRILEEFEKRQGIKLTYVPFFAVAVVKSLLEFPVVNCSIEGDTIIYKNFINLGLAVAAPTGLIVPVVKHVEGKSFGVIAQALTDVAARARTKKLMPDEIIDGTFSMTNYGIFGNIIGTPIINQPQVAILGIGAIKKRPIVLTDEAGNDSIGIRSMVYLTLSFDHRIIDGAIGGQFLSRIKWHLEHFDVAMVNSWQ